MRSQLTRLVHRVLTALPDPAIQVLSRAKAVVVDRQSARFYQPLAEGVFPTAEKVELLVANDDAAVFRVTRADGAVILKLARTEVADELLSIEAASLDELGSLDTLGDWRQLVASVDDRGTHEHGTWFTQTMLPGQSAFGATADPATVVAASLAALHPVHEATRQSVTATDEVLAELVSDPIALIKQWRPDHIDKLTTIDNELRRRLAGRELSLSRMHGDFAPTNVLWSNDTGGVTGIVDWKFGPELAPPEIDLVHFSLSLLMHQRASEYGSTVIDLLDGHGNDRENALVDLAVEAGPNHFDASTALSLAWLQHISFGLHKAADLRQNPIWLHNNIDTVIDRLAD